MPYGGRTLALFLVLLAGAFSGCGDGSNTAQSERAGTIQSIPTPNRHCEGMSKAKQARQRAALERDLRRLQAAAATVKGYSQEGNSALNAALDRFLLDVAIEALPVERRSDYINRAAAIVAPRCYLCFQALEANRPLAAGGKLACG